MATQRVEVEGATKAVATLNLAALRLRDLSSGATTASSVVASSGRTRAPRRTGRLAASITGRSEQSDAVVVASVRYAAPVHYGVPSKRMAPRPFLSSAAAATQTVWVQAYATNVARVMDAVKGA